MRNVTKAASNQSCILWLMQKEEMSQEGPFPETIQMLCFFKQDTYGLSNL